MTDTPSKSEPLRQATGDSLPVIERTRRRILDEGAILCIRLNDGGSALEACRAAARGGLGVLEIALTTPGALDLIRTLSAEQDLLLGAGTVLSPADVRAVDEAGGRFVMSPVFDPAVVDEAHRRGLLAVPGTATPTEILAAHRHGALMVKVFPSGQLGGADYIRRVRGPLPEVALVPTSGPTSQTLADYLAAGAVAVGIGPEVVSDGFELAEVEAAARRIWSALSQAREARNF